MYDWVEYSMVSRSFFWVRGIPYGYNFGKNSSIRGTIIV